MSYSEPFPSDPRHIKRILPCELHLRLLLHIWLQNHQHLRYLVGYSIIQAIKIKSVMIMGNPVAHATHPTPWNAGFRFAEFFRELLDMLPRSGNRHSHGILFLIILSEFLSA